MNVSGRPSWSAMPPGAAAVSVSPDTAAPSLVIVGAPVGARFAGRLRYSVRVLSPDQSRPAFHWKRHFSGLALAALKS